jgi:hypothetical protein
MITLIQISHVVADRLKQAKSLLSELQLSAARARADQIKVEAELFGGRYHLPSKNDDDLPLVRPGIGQQLR